MSLLLTDEEILNALNKKPFDCAKHITLSEGYCNELREIARAQLKKVTDKWKAVLKEVKDVGDIL